MTSESCAGFRFIPVSRQQLIAACEEQLPESERSRWRAFADRYCALLHEDFHRKQQAFKQAYAPEDPNIDLIDVTEGAVPSTPSVQQLLTDVLERANYEALSEQDLQVALEESSLFDVRLQVDFTEFEEALLFCRGVTKRSEEVRSWWGLRRKTVEFINYERVALYLRFHKNLEVQQPLCKPGTTVLKLFQNVPKADLEMLFPNTRVRMRLRDKLLLGIPAAIGGGVVITTKLGGSLILLASLLGYWLGAREKPVELDQAALVTLMVGLGALAAHSWKQFNNFKNRKLHFIQSLTQNLYFKNLDNNAGVFYRLLDEAEEEEGKEALLAYYFLWQGGEPLSCSELDVRIERWLQSLCGVAVDFEIDDALRKLHDYGLVDGLENGSYRARELEVVLQSLKHHWISRLAGNNDG